MMKSETLFDYMSMMDDRFITEADSTTFAEGMEDTEAAKGKTSLFRFPSWARGMAVAAAIAVTIALPNLNAATAYALQNLPVVGYYFKIVTFRNFEYSDGLHEMSVETPVLSGESVSTEGESTLPAGSGQEAAASAAEDSENVSAAGIESVNAQMQDTADELMEEFKEQASGELSESPLSLNVVYNVVTDSDRYYTLKMSAFAASADGYQFTRYYTLDKTTGEEVTLKSLFGEDSGYVTVISDEIKRQMREQMAEAGTPPSAAEPGSEGTGDAASDPESESSGEIGSAAVTYWIDSDMPEEDFSEIAEDQNFYINEDGELVISFNEGDVAPHSMGIVEFIIPDEVTAGLQA